MPKQIRAQSRPMNAKERAIWRETKARIGKSKGGRHEKVISVSVDRGLLDAADAYAPGWTARHMRPPDGEGCSKASGAMKRVRVQVFCSSSTSRTRGSQ
jgi:hypothetical protein